MVLVQVVQEHLSLQFVVTLQTFFSPIELFPSYKQEISLRKCIGGMKQMNVFGEIDEQDVYHHFRKYPKHMRDWISNLSEGQSAFDNTDINKVPHQIKDGQIVINKRKNGDKYRRQIWDKVGPCVHTRNDQLASQNTIHPADDRVFSVRELMMMTVPNGFRWSDKDDIEINSMSIYEKRAFLKKNEVNIRQSLGEAAPTSIFQNIAVNIKSLLSKRYISDKEVYAEINKNTLLNKENLIQYINQNTLNLGFASLSRIVELANANRNSKEAYFTNKSLITEIIKVIPSIDKDCIKVLEPSVGAGNFIPFIAKLFEKKTRVDLTLIDIDKEALDVLKVLVNHINLPNNISIKYKCTDFLTDNSTSTYDLLIGNPPFSKSVRGERLNYYRNNSVNKQALNTSAFFLEKALLISNYVAMIMPKFLLNTSEFLETRNLLETMCIDTIIDFGERGFNDVLIETIAVLINPIRKPNSTMVISKTDNEFRLLPQSYICDRNFPYWLIYRNSDFDDTCEKLIFDVFDVFRDRQITNSMITPNNTAIRVLKSRNIADNGLEILDIEGYNAYIDNNLAKNLSVYRFLDIDNVYLTPNMTYKPRVIRKPKGVLVNGSIAILSLKDGQSPMTNEEMRFFSSNSYRNFYRIARNRQTRSLNVDANSVFFFGRLVVEGVNS